MCVLYKQLHTCHVMGNNTLHQTVHMIFRDIPSLCKQHGIILLALVITSSLYIMNLNPQIIQLLRSKYSKTRSCIQTNNGYTKFFPVFRGLQQGCNLSPLLFNLYINELPRLLKRTTLLNQSTSCLLFADDIAMFSDNPHDLQESLNLLQKFCSSQVGHVNFQRGNQKLAVLKLCKQWNHLIWAAGHEQSHDNHASTRTVTTKFAKFAFEEVIFSSKSRQ